MGKVVDFRREMRAARQRRLMRRAMVPVLRLRWRRARLPGWTYLVGGLGIALAMIFATSPFSPLDTLRHLAAAPNCDAARAMGLAPAREGQPGYYPRHDRDGDGVACEVYRGR